MRNVIYYLRPALGVTFAFLHSFIKMILVLVVSSTKIGFKPLLLLSITILIYTLKKINLTDMNLEVQQKYTNIFVVSNNWYLLASPLQHVVPSPATWSTTAPIDLPPPKLIGIVLTPVRAIHDMKASRRSAQCQAQPPPIPSPQPIPLDVNTLFGYLQTDLHAETSRMNPQQTRHQNFNLLVYNINLILIFRILIIFRIQF